MTLVSHQSHLSFMSSPYLNFLDWQTELGFLTATYIEIKVIFGVTSHIKATSQSNCQVLINSYITTGWMNMPGVHSYSKNAVRLCLDLKTD